MTELSPAAQACVAAWIAGQRRQTRTAGRREALGAFAEALANQVVRAAGALDDTVEDCLRGAEREHIRSCILTIAAELRGEPTTTETQP